MRTLLYGAALSLAFGLAAQAQPPGAAAPGTVNPPASKPPTASAPAASSTAPSTAPPSTAPPSTAPPSAASPPAADASATTSPYKAGMAIKDAQGSTIGTIARVVRTPDGATTISASVDGRTVNLPASALTPGADGGAVSSMSKAQITASTAPPT